MSVATVAEYVRREWACHGVEVKATGLRSLTLILPPELLGMTELCIELWNIYGASTDFKHTAHGASITVWIPLTPIGNSTPHRGSYIAAAATIVLAAAAATEPGWLWMGQAAGWMGATAT